MYIWILNHNNVYSMGLTEYMKVLISVSKAYNRCNVQNVHLNKRELEVKVKEKTDVNRE